MKSEILLLKAAQKLDEEALLTIFDLYAPEIYKHALRLTKDPVDADNITGEVFAKLLDEFASNKKPRTNLRSHLHEIANQLILDRQKGIQPLLLEITEEAVFDLLIEGLTDKQIAIGLGKTENVIKEYVSNILKKLGAINRNMIGGYSKYRLVYEALPGNPSTEAPPPDVRKKKKRKGK